MPNMNVRQQISLIATWERFIAAVMFLSLIPAQIIITFILGILIFLLYRRDYRYLTYHSLLAALWQLSLYIIHGLFTAPLRQIRLQMHALAVAHPHINYQGFLFNPWQWGHLSQTGQLVMAIMLASLVVNFVIALWGAALTLRGRIVRLPVLSLICEKMMPAELH